MFQQATRPCDVTGCHRPSLPRHKHLLAVNQCECDTVTVNYCQIQLHVCCGSIVFILTEATVAFDPRGPGFMPLFYWIATTLGKLFTHIASLVFSAPRNWGTQWSICTGPI